MASMGSLPFWNTRTIRPESSWGNSDCWLITDIVKLMVEIESFGMSSNEFDKETGSSDRLKPKQMDLSCVHALNELYLHEIHVVLSKHEADQLIMEYLVKISKKARILLGSFKRENMIHDILYTSYTPKLFKTLSLDESRSPKYNLFSDLEENFEEEVAEIMAETMEQYMSKTQADYGSGIARPKIIDKDHFELKGQFLKELRDNTFSGSDHEDANE
ncbi:hypothetical protein Tco_0186482 [Tanacetum coccineum]